MHAMMAIKGVWLYLHPFLTSAIDEGESTASRLGRFAQLSISQKAIGTLPEDGNVMPKHVGATIHN
jgi:hypothetical protein